MSDPRRSPFYQDLPDSRLPSQSPQRPATISEVAGAHWSLSGQNIDYNGQQAENDAYAPILNELAKREPTDWLGNEKNYFGAYRSSHPYNYDLIWQDVAKYRKADPTFFKDIPAHNAAEFATWVKQQEASRRAAANDVTSRQSGLVQGAVGLGTDVVGGLRDPINLGSMVISGGAAAPVEGAARSIFSSAARAALREGVANAGIETVELPSQVQSKARFGETMTAGDMVQDVATAGVGGALFGGAVHVGGDLAKKGLEAAASSPAAQAIGKAVAPVALARVPIDKASDADVASAFSRAVPSEVRTPDQQAALHVITRQADVDRASPFEPNRGGMQLHADATNAATDTLTAAGDRTPVGPRLRAQAVPLNPKPVDLSSDRIIKFVMHDLEGGAAVVNYSSADGGVTKYGIAAKANPGVDVANLSEADAAAIAKRKYWRPEYDRADPRAAAIAFDAGYISGPDYGSKLLRDSGGDPARALELYREHLNHIADTVPGKEKYRKGWNNRVDKLAKLVGGDDRPVLKPDGFANSDELDFAQRQLDDANSATALMAHEDAIRARGGEGETVDLPESRDPLENSGALDPSIAPVVPDAHIEATTPEPLRPAPDAALAVRNYVSDNQGSLRPEIVAKALDIAPEDARQILTKLAAAPDVNVRQIGDTFRRAPVERAPVDLMRFIAKAGGIADNEGHSLTKGRNLQKFVPGAGNLIRKGGMSLDRAREMAAEAGYFHDQAPQDAISNTTTADFLDLLEQAHGGGHYALYDLAAVEARDARRAATTAHADARAAVDARTGDHGFDLTPDELSRAADLVAHDGLSRDDAILRVVNEHIKDALDAAAIEGENLRYAQLADDFEATIAEGAGGAQGGVDRSGANATDTSGSSAGVIERGSAEEDARQEAGLDGPPLLDGREDAAFDDPRGAGAKAVADSLEHDLRAEIDPNIAERQRQQARLKADSPMRAATDQESLIGAPLFDAANQHGFVLDESGTARTAEDILNEIDADEAAIKATRSCL